MIKVLRGIFFVAAIALFMTAINYHYKTYEPDTSRDYSVDWQNDIAGSMQALRERQRQSDLYLDRIHGYENTRDTLGGLAVICGIIFVGLWLPWGQMSASVAQHGAEINTKLEDIAGSATTSLKEMTRGSPIVGRHGLTTYSVADELMKWNELRENGVVSEEEFSEARARLLKCDDSAND